MSIDVFELRNKGEIWINNKSLIEIIRELEMPFVKAELQERLAKGENPEELYLLAGDYVYPQESNLYLPSRNLLDEPASLADSGFVLEENHPERRKSLLLECTCGIPECWFLQVRINVTNELVQWYDFSQFHRDWVYNLEYNFNRKEYENQLIRKY